MSESTEHKGVAEQPMYVVWVLLLIAVISLLEFVIPVGIYRLVYGVPKMSDWVTMPVTEYSSGALWKGRIWYEVMKVGPGQLNGKATLTSFGPEKGDITETEFQTTFPAIGFVVQGEKLWVVSAGSVTEVEGDKSVEFKPKRRLARTSDPFLYEDQLAVIDMTSKPNPTLLAFQNGEWTDIGRIVVPYSYATAIVDGKKTLITVPSQSTVGTSLTDVKVVGDNGQLHVFISDGSHVAHRAGLEIAPVSALAPENISAYVDLSNLAEWEVVCSTSPIIARGGKPGWRVGLLKGEPVVITTSSMTANPFQNTSLLAYRLHGGKWEKIGEQSSPALMNLLAVSDGEKTYVAGQSFAQTLRLHELSDTELRRTGTVLKAPVAPFQEPLQRWARIYQWVYWPGLLIMALGISRLMAVYLDSHYQFGLTTVELASYTRRGVARLIDMFVFWTPNYALTVAFGMSSQEQVAENMDKFFDAGPGGMMMRFAWLILSFVLSALLFLIVNSGLQGWWGITLGKWICGIRTMRSTLRPCGFFRALFRELLLAADTLFGMTLLPATLTIAFTRNRQRLGDLMADTIVIRKLKLNPGAVHDEFSKA